MLIGSREAPSTIAALNPIAVKAIAITTSAMSWFQWRSRGRRGRVELTYCIVAS
jgi:hypothetical protein